ncbi:unnamed protein product [Lasius platythorax]|uniref:Uncharacterized protein n=1 Tax=Lasius platythorax TaxID=488582 RepID=A0AAV2P914_9HYME
MSRSEPGIKTTCFVATLRLRIGRRKSSGHNGVFIHAPRATANEQEEVKWTGNFSATTNRVARMGKGRRPCDAIPTYSAACHESWGRDPTFSHPFLPPQASSLPRSYRSFADRRKGEERGRAIGPPPPLHGIA